MPGIREAASAAFGSGNAPIWSDDTTLTMFGAVRCWLRARAWPSAMGSAVTETDSEKFAGASFTSTTRVWPEVTVTSARSVLWPRYVASSEYLPRRDRRQAERAGPIGRGKPRGPVERDVRAHQRRAARGVGDRAGDGTRPLSESGPGHRGDHRGDENEGDEESA